MAISKYKLLIIDSDIKTFSRITESGRFGSFDIIHCEDPDMAFSIIDNESPDFILSEIYFRDGTDGLKFIRSLKGKYNTLPVMILSIRKDVTDIVLGLEFGADSFIAKPFSNVELEARINALMRLTERLKKAELSDNIKSDVIEYSGLVIDKKSYKVISNGNIIEMPPKELELLYHLASKPDKMFTREELLSEIWGIYYYGGARTVDVHIKRIRAKLSEASSGCGIQTVWGKGYKFVVNNG